MTEFEAILRGVVEGRLPVSEAHRVLRERASFSFGTNPALIEWHDPLPPELDIPLTVADLRRVLVRYLRGEWTAANLQAWAEVISLVDTFAAPEPPPDDEYHYDELWNVVHELATPAVYDEINETSVAAKLARLERFGTEIAPRAT